jgi:phosphomannomutase
VSFPNPEEPGAIDAALALAARVHPDVVLANDPDADRCAVAVPTVRGWRMLSGDELGVLLADAVTRRVTGGTLATSIVSSSLLSRLAPARGFDYVETLTGFKWIGRVPGLVYGYEEALGYCVAPELVRDKDGISALLLVVETAARLRAEDRTLLDRLADLYREFGVHATDQLAVRVADLSLIADVMARLRSNPPSVLGGLGVRGVDDLAAGHSVLPPTDALRFRLADESRVVVRPSGTEPKLKCYLEVVVPVRDDDVAAGQIAAAGRLDAIRSDLATRVAIS